MLLKEIDAMTLNETIDNLDLNIPKEREILLRPLIEFIKEKRKANLPCRLNFICTHNSRRSHLSQIWAHVAALYHDFTNVDCYSGGTEATAMFPMIGETLVGQGLQVIPLSEGENPVYAIKHFQGQPPIIAFSKKYDHPFNPDADFGAVMTCDHADQNCPFIPGAKNRFPLRYEDPKSFDNTDIQKEKYLERSCQIASEMFFVFRAARS